MNKKGEMPWWLILLVLAVMFLAVMSFISGGIVKKALKSISPVQDETANQADCLAIFDKSNDADGDGWIDTKQCDECTNDPARHKHPCTGESA